MALPASAYDPHRTPCQQSFQHDCQAARDGTCLGCTGVTRKTFAFQKTRGPNSSAQDTPKAFRLLIIPKSAQSPQRAETSELRNTPRAPSARFSTFLVSQGTGILFQGFKRSQNRNAIQNPLSIANMALPCYP